MILADWIAIGLVALFIILGAVVGFGRGLKFFTSGIFGFIISVIITYFFLGVVLSWGFVQDIAVKIDEAIIGDGSSKILVWLAENSFVNKAIWAVLVFIVVQIIRIIIVKIIKGVFEAPNGFCKFINKVLGIVFFVCILAILALLAAHIVTLISDDLVATVNEYLSGSALKLDVLFNHNPLDYIIN